MVKRGIKKGDDSKSEDKDSSTGDTTGAHIGDTTTTEEFTAPSRGASISAHLSKTNIQSPCPSCTVKEILGTHPINDEYFWVDTNPGDVSIDTTNNEEMLARSHITEYHTREYK